VVMDWLFPLQPEALSVSLLFLPLFLTPET